MDIVELMNGDWQVTDVDGDPLITVSFHNEARLIPTMVKRQLVRQMVLDEQKEKLTFVGKVFLAMAFTGFGLLGYVAGWLLHKL